MMNEIPCEAFESSQQKNNLYAKLTNEWQELKGMKMRLDFDEFYMPVWECYGYDEVTLLSRHSDMGTAISLANDAIKGMALIIETMVKDYFIRRPVFQHFYCALCDLHTPSAGHDEGTIVIPCTMCGNGATLVEDN